MATRSHIGILNEDGTVDYIYCHWDGYPEGVGHTLSLHYTEESKIRELIDLGWISFLRENIKPPYEHELAEGRVRGLLERFDPPPHHSFDRPLEGVTIAYHRDRGEELVKGTFQSKKLYYDPDGWIEYYYLFENGEWYVNEVKLSGYGY